MTLNDIFRGFILSVIVFLSSLSTGCRNMDFEKSKTDESIAINSKLKIQYMSSRSPREFYPNFTDAHFIIKINDYIINDIPPTDDVSIGVTRRGLLAVRYTYGYRGTYVGETCVSLFYVNNSKVKKVGTLLESFYDNETFIEIPVFDDDSLPTIENMLRLEPTDGWEDVVLPPLN